MRLNRQSPFFSGCVAAVIFAVIWLVTGGGANAGLVEGSLITGAVATAVSFIIHAVMVTMRARR